MFSRFFIDRPIFATVISILITLAGAVALPTLPVAQYPMVAPPTVSVECSYPGASAAVVSQAVAAPIEQQVNGVEETLYMSSTCGSDGSYSLSLAFKPGVDINVAQVLVQNRVALAMPQLPDVVRQMGVTTRKRSLEILLTASVNSPDQRYDQLYLSNFALLRIKDELARLPGVSEVVIFGQQDYSLRIWLDPDTMAARSLTPGDITAALREQNYQVAAGQIGQPPGKVGTAIQVPLSTRGRLQTPEEFGQIVLRVTKDGRMIRLRDVARVELAARSQLTSNRFNGKTSVGVAVFQLPSANALATAEHVKAKLRELSADFPDGLICEVGFDTTPFIRESIWEVFKTLRDATILVAIVVLVFLRGWRAAVIPLAAIPVAIVGTFAAMAVVGFSINNLTLFGLVLAIGIVVDDAIVVVEAVEYHIEQGLAPREAAIAAMEQVTGPVIAVGLVLSAVFIPCAFISGLVGVFFRQFALTIAVSTVISALNSLTLSPALARLMLRPRGARRDPLTWLLDACLGWFFRLFDAGFQLSGRFYVAAVGKLLRVVTLVLLVYAGLVALTVWGYQQLPRGFVPPQDKGFLVASVLLPDASATQRTREVIAKLEQIALSTEGVKNVNSVTGMSFAIGAAGPNFGSMFIILDSFEVRQARELHSDQIMATLNRKLAAAIPEAEVRVTGPAPVSGVGRAGGFRMMVEDRGDVGLTLLQTYADAVVEKAKLQPGLIGLMTPYKANAPQLWIDIDRDACQAQGINLEGVFTTLQGYLGSRYVNDFNRFGRTWQVIVQADASYRNQVDDIQRLNVRNAAGRMVPLGSVVQVKLIGQPTSLARYNMHPAAAVMGNLAPGVSTGQGIRLMEAVARQELPANMSFEWTELALLERQSANTGLWVFGLSVVFVLLVLAALYESWTLPLAVVLVVPMCVLSSIAGVAWAGMDVNVFTQIGFIVLIGLASKNAILIVEFAKLKRDEGVDIRSATLAACGLRLRPILMTSFAFILGVVPLLFARGAGAEMRHTLGVAVFSGMLGVTLFGVFLTPVFFYVVDHLAEGALLRAAAWRRVGAEAAEAVTLGALRRPAWQLFRAGATVLAPSWRKVRRKMLGRKKLRPSHTPSLAGPPKPPVEPAEPSTGKVLS